jgi:predicted transcriptional regulator
MLEKLRGDIQLLDRHIEVMKAVMEHEPIGIVKLSLLMDLPYHRIRYSLRVLEQMGYIRASPAGAVTTIQAKRLLSNIDQDVDELVTLLTALKEKKTPQR